MAEALFTKTENLFMFFFFFSAFSALMSTFSSGAGKSCPSQLERASFTLFCLVAGSTGAAVLLTLSSKFWEDLERLLGLDFLIPLTSFLSFSFPFSFGLDSFFGELRAELALFEVGGVLGVLGELGGGEPVGEDSEGGGMPGGEYTKGGGMPVGGGMRTGLVPFVWLELLALFVPLALAELLGALGEGGSGGGASPMGILARTFLCTLRERFPAVWLTSTLGAELAGGGEGEEGEEGEEDSSITVSS